MSDDLPALPPGEEQRHLPAERTDDHPVRRGERLPARVDDGSMPPRQRTNLVGIAVLGVLAIAVVTVIALVSGGDDDPKKAAVGTGELLRFRLGNGSTTVERLSEDGKPTGEQKIAKALTPYVGAPTSPRALAIDGGVLYIVDGKTFEASEVTLPAGANSVTDLGTAMLATAGSVPVATIAADGTTRLLAEQLAQPGLTLQRGFVSTERLLAMSGADSTVLVDLDDLDKTVVIPGALLALRDDIALISTGTGSSTTLQLAGISGTTHKPVTLPAPSSARIIGDSKALVVLESGAIVEADFGAGTTTQRGSVLPSKAMRIVGDDRIIIADQGKATVLDATGKQIGLVDDIGDDPTIVPGEKCSVVFTVDGPGRVIENDNAKASSTFRTTTAPLSSREDGCSIAVLSEDHDGKPRLVRSGRLLDLGGDIAAWGPDGTRAVVIRTDGDQRTAYLVRLNGGKDVELDTNLDAAYALVNN